MRRATGDRPLYDFTPHEIHYPWYRNPVWIDLPTITSSDEKFAAVYSIDDTTENYLRLYVSGTGTLQIDWGDGNTEIVTSGVWNEHQYDGANTYYANTDVSVTFGSNTVTFPSHPYANNMRISFYTSTTSDVYEHTAYFVANTTANTFQLATVANGTPISIGSGTGTILPYKQALLQITASSNGATAGTITNINFNQRHTGLPFNYLSGLRDVEMSLPNATYFHFGDSAYQTPEALERLKIHNLQSRTNLAYAFRDMKKLESFDLSGTANVTYTDLVYGFYYAQSLTHIPDIDANINGRTQNMFSTCWHLRSIPRFNEYFTNNHQPFNTFVACRSIKRFDQPEMWFTFNNTSVTSVSSIISDCSSLLELPDFDFGDLSPGINMNALLYYLRSLSTVKYIDFSKANNLASLTSVSTRIRNLYTISAPLNTSMVNMFQYTSVPEITVTDTANVDSINGMAWECGMRAFNKRYGTDLTSSTRIDRMFYNTTQFRDIGPLYLSSACTNAYQTFQSNMIRTINISNTSGLSNVAYMFNSCVGLESLPDMDMSGAANAYGFATTLLTCKEVNIANGFPTATNVTNMYYNLFLCEHFANTSFPEATEAQNAFRETWAIDWIDLDLPKATSLNTVLYRNKNLQRVKINAPLATTGSAAFTIAYGGHNSLEYLTGDLSAMGDNQAILTYATRLKKITITHNNSLSLQKLNMSGQALDDLYTYLPTVSGKTINITNNRGAGEDTPSIATAKGWTVTG